MSNESSNAKNVANFAQLISDVAGFGAAYTPTNDLIKKDALDDKLLEAQASLSTVDDAGSGNVNAVNERFTAFESLSKFVTRVGSAAEVSVNDAEFSTNLKTLTRKLQGRRATPKASAAMKTANADPNQPPEDAPPTVSSSQMSYDSQEANFASLISLLKSQPDYAPNEADLKITALETRLADLQAKNQAVRQVTTTTGNARATRNQILYDPQDGLVARANLVKKYIKSVFGADSPQYRQISGLQFTSRKLT